MSNERSKCFDLNKKHYERWKKLIENLNDDKPNEVESKKKLKDKPKKFEDYFKIDSVIKGVNNLEYQPYLGA